MVKKMKKAARFFKNLKAKEKISFFMGFIGGVIVFIILPRKEIEEIFISICVSALAAALITLVFNSIFNFFNKN